MSEAPPGEITEAEYETWLTPLSAGLLLRHMDGSLARAAIFGRIRTGRIRAVAQQIITLRGERQSGPLHYQLIPRERWGERTGGDLLWSAGDISIEVASGGSMSSLTTMYVHSGVRFDPSGVRDLLPQQLPENSPALIRDERHAALLQTPPPERQPQPVVTPELEARRTKSISVETQEKMSRVLVEVFGAEADERFAHRVILAAYPTHKVPREPFLEIFRAIRGYKSPGKTRQKVD